MAGAPWLLQNPSTLRNRVSYSSITPGQQGTNPIYATYYNYDIEGNVSALLQDFGNTGPMYSSGQEYKRIDYQYDLVSGKVNSVGYQLGKPDAFMHFYQYDAENRLTDVYSTADSVTIEHEAHYDYYKHGPLGRSLIGQNQVQGIDYAYMLQGWLKSVNGNILDSTRDMGHDGDPAIAAREYVGKDAYGFSLHYFDGDYQPINGSSFLTGLKSQLGSAYKGLYNGNISSMAVNIGILNNPKLYNYRYDQLNRLTGMDVFNGSNSGQNLWTSGLAATGDYREKASYDENGNILTYIRHGFGSTQAMDSMNYNYNPGKNQLNYIADGVSSGSYANDLDNQSANNYTYDEIGNLKTDAQAGITSPMTWSVYGKLLSVTNSSNTITYNYDAAGNRIGKTVGSTTTWYVRDAQGNVLSTYSGSGMPIQEQDLYGSSRLGMIFGATALAGTSQYLDALGSGTLFTFTRGRKLFELTNHLGNVLATVSDKKFGTAVTGIPSQISYYTTDVKSAQDYYPGGMLQSGRSFNSQNLVNGFNGKRYDNEVYGVGGFQDYGLRMYDPRTVYFPSPDPLTKKYPYYSPYQFAGNNPIRFIDLDGAEPANNPKAPGASEKEAMSVVQGIETMTARNDAQYNFLSSGSWRSSDQDIKGTYSCGTRGGYVTDTKGDPNNRFNMYVHNGATLDVDESQAAHFNNYEAFIVHRLTANFASGEGAQNYNFPTNGIISSKFLNSDILKSALSDFNTGKLGAGKSAQYSFGAKELASDLLNTGTLSSITGFVGSGTIMMVPNKDGVKVTIFNVTSLTSGDLFKNPNNDANWPKSYVRDPNKTTPYGNISETFNLFLPWGSPLLSK